MFFVCYLQTTFKNNNFTNANRIFAEIIYFYINAHSYFIKKI